MINKVFPEILERAVFKKKNNDLRFCVWVPDVGLKTDMVCFAGTIISVAVILSEATH